MLSLVTTIGPFVLGAVAAIALIGAYTHFRRARRAPYFRIRRDSTRKGWRWIVVMILAMAGSFALFRLRPFAETLDASLAPLPASPPTNEALFETAVPDEPQELTPFDLVEGPPTITPTEAAPTITPTPYIEMIDSSVTPPADATLAIQQISSGISSNLTPVNPGRTFPVGTPRIYFWVEFGGMANGMSWSRVLLRNGEVVRSESEAWEEGTEGLAHYWFEAQGGWPAGSYEIQFYLGDRLVATDTYDIIN